MAKIISYDLDKPGQKYDKVIEIIKSHTRWAKITESCWLVVTDDSCADIRNKLNAVTDSNDRILVATLTGVAAWRNLLTSDDNFKERINL